MGPEAYRRRASVRWTSSSGDGDAAEAVAEIEAWLAAHDTADTDWDGVLAQVRDALLRASVEPVLMRDAEARTILASLAAEEAPEALDAALDALRRRVTFLVEARERAALDEVRPVQRIIADDRAKRPSRSMLRI